MDGPLYPKCKKVHPCSASRKFIPHDLNRIFGQNEKYPKRLWSKNALAVKVKSSLTLKNVHNKQEKSFILPKQWKPAVVFS